MFALRYSIVLVFLLAVSACSAKLIDIDRSMPRLNLSEEQSKVVRPKMMAIKEIAENYELEKEKLAEEINSARAGSRGSDTGGADRDELRGRFQEFRKKREEFLKRREAYLSAIKIHVADIRAVLNKEQVITFEKMKLPELEMPEMPGGRRPGMSGRGGGGRGGRGGGGRGGGKF